MNFSPNQLEKEELLERIEKLTDQEKQELAQKLIGKNSPLTVILGGCNDINNSFVIQINNGVDKVSEQVDFFAASYCPLASGAGWFLLLD